MSNKMLRSDDDIRDEIEEIFFQNPILNSPDIEIKVENGVVTLLGVIENKLSGFEAESSVADIEGVKEVINLLKIKPYHLSPPL